MKVSSLTISQHAAPGGLSQQLPDFKKKNKTETFTVCATFELQREGRRRSRAPFPPVSPPSLSCPDPCWVAALGDPELAEPGPRFCSRGLVKNKVWEARSCKNLYRLLFNFARGARGAPAGGSVTEERAKGGVSRLERRATFKTVQDILTLCERNGTQAGVTHCVCFGPHGAASCQKTHVHAHARTHTHAYN